MIYALYEENFYFCGRKSIDKFPYCKLHVLYAFQPKNAKEEDIITEEDIWARRPGTGEIKAENLTNLYGKIAIKDIEKDEFIKHKDFK